MNKQNWVFRGIGLPGDTRRAAVGTKCCSCRRPASVRVQGEDLPSGEDSALCSACWASRRYPTTPSVAFCDWRTPGGERCRWQGTSDEVVTSRDPEEGECGPVYDFCPICWGRFARWRQEEASYDMYGALYTQAEIDEARRQFREAGVPFSVSCGCGPVHHILAEYLEAGYSGQGQVHVLQEDALDCYECARREDEP